MRSDLLPFASSAFGRGATELITALGVALGALGAIVALVALLVWMDPTPDPQPRRASRARDGAATRPERDRSETSVTSAGQTTRSSS